MAASSPSSFASPLLLLSVRIFAVPSFRLQGKAKLDMSSCGLSGRIPDELGKLTSLKLVGLADNKLEGAIPRSASPPRFFWKPSVRRHQKSSNHLVTLLRVLDLSKNSLSGAIPGRPEFPSWLQSQTRIEMIDLGSAGIRGVLPEWIWNFSSPITSLNVSTNNITGKLPTSLEQLKMLTTLNMRHNQLEGSIPHLPASIQVLDLSHNYLSGLLPQSFGNKELRYLLLSHNFLTGAIPTDLCNMVSMEVIDISNNNLSGELPNCWNKDANLYIIDFSSNNLCGEIPSTLGSLSSLITLHLSKNNLSGMLPTSLKSCNRLMFLDVGENNLSGNIPKWIGDGLQALVLLSLGMHLGNSEWDTTPFIGFKVYGVPGAYFSVYTDHLEVTYKGQRPIFTRYYLLKSIDLSANKLTCEIPSELGLLSALLSLNLSRNRIEGSIPDELGRMKNLESLDLSWNDLSGADRNACKSLATYLQQLRRRGRRRGRGAVSIQALAVMRAPSVRLRQGEEQPTPLQARREPTYPLAAREQQLQPGSSAPVRMSP
ncbi:hypothetical protein EJB05_47921, partial [Eragrostis curvula]